jgi:hypothetical protein
MACATPADVLRLKAVNAATGQLEPPPPGHWERAAAALQLVPEERRRLAACHDLFEGKVRRLEAQRARLAAALAGSVRSGGVVVQGGLDSAGGGGGGAGSRAERDWGAQRALLAALVAQPAAAAAAGAAGGEAQPAAPSTSAAAAAPPPADPAELLARLDRSLMAEFVLDTVAGMCVMQQLPWDKAARLVVHAWPYQPDIRLLLGLIAAQAGEHDGV